MVDQDVWVFDDNALSLTKGAATGRMTRKCADVLAALLRRKGQVVSQTELLEDVWPGMHVTPDLVREYVSDLRALLQDNPRKPKIIETVRGRGYRLIGPLRSVDGTLEAAQPVRLAVISRQDSALNVQWTRIAEGLANDIAINLSRYSDLAVVALEKPIAEPDTFSRIACAHDLDYLLSLSVSVAGDTANVRAMLVETGSQRITWSDRFQQRVNRTPGLINDIAAQVAGTIGGLLGQVHGLQRQLVQRKMTDSLNAYENYLLGCDAEEKYDRDGTLTALHHLEAAVQQDPALARAWLVLGWVANRIHANGWGDGTIDWKAREHRAIEHALAADPRDPMILADAASVRGSHGETARANALIERAVDLVENQADAGVFVSQIVAMVGGDGPRALALFDASVAQNRRPPTWYKVIECRVAFFAGAFERSVHAGAHRPEYLPNRVFRSLSLAKADRLNEELEVWGELYRSDHGFDPERFARAAPITHDIALAAYRSAVEILS